MKHNIKSTPKSKIIKSCPPTPEYNSPKIYDCEYGSYTADFDIFCNTITNGSALDIACGTGRITIQLSKMGLKCTGIDASELMLIEAKGKTENIGLNITYLKADMKNFNLNQKFDLITMAGNSFQALLTKKEQIDCLTSVCYHMKKEGVFIMNTRNTTKNELQSTLDFEHWHDFIDHHGQTVQVYGIQTFDSSTNITKYITKRIWRYTETLTEIELKFTTYDQLVALLKECGLKIVKIYGSFSKESFDPVNSKNIILICKKYDNL